jgi:two-component system, cell cycle sensor histidine kinase and response regulator CckA
MMTGRKMDLYFDRILCGIIILNDNYNIISINKKAVDILEESFDDAGSLELPDKFLDKISLSVQNEDYSTVEDICILIINKKEKYLKRHIEFQHDEELKSVIISFIDITKYQMIENNYFHFQKIESFGEVLKSITLEYNNHLAAIMGFSSFLKSMINPLNETFNYLDIIEKSASKASNLTNQLMSFAGSGYFKQIYVNFNKIISQNIELFRKTLPPNITINSDLCVEDIFLYWDENQLNQIVINTILNAKESIEKNENKKDKGEIFIESTVENNIVKYVIKDNGTGIKKELKDKIFEPYFTTKEIGKHTGLGLSVTQGIVKNIGGNIDFVSDENGTAFTVSLPYSEVDINKIKINDLFGNNEKVLVIDDVDTIRNLASIILMQKKYIAFTAESGKAGMEILEKEKIDLVLLDIIMPDISGEEVYRQIKNKYPDIPIIILTGCMEEKIVTNFIKENQIEVIIKPFEIFDFLNKIHSVLHKK